MRNNNQQRDQQQARQAEAIALAITDPEDPDYKRSLRIECRKIEKQIADEEKATAMYNDERLRTNYFWLIAKKELEDKQAELRNKEREIQDFNEKHQIETKIYK